jgi:hypothetical protein
MTRVRLRAVLAVDWPTAAGWIWRRTGQLKVIHHYGRAHVTAESRRCSGGDSLGRKNPFAHNSHAAGLSRAVFGLAACICSEVGSLAFTSPSKHLEVRLLKRRG